MGTIKRHANWPFAEMVLSLVLPGADFFGPDRIPGIRPEDWIPFDVEDRDSAEIERDLLSHCSGLRGPVVVVNGTSFDADQGPYFVDAAALPGFVDTFDVAVRDYFVNGSVFLISPFTGQVVLVHEDGFLAKVVGNAIGSWPES